MARTVVITQSNYLPWRGYFDLLRSADEALLLDSVQYTRRDWRNRNRIKTPQGTQWLTIPVEVKGKYHQAIKDTKISDLGWGKSHWRTLCHCYTKAPHFEYFRGLCENLYLGCKHTFLSDVNRDWIEAVCKIMGITTRVSQSMDYRLSETDPSARLLEVCLQAKAGVYLSGPAARTYLDEDLFTRNGIAVRYMDYAGYSEYPQLNPPFEHAVTVLDLLFMTGTRAPDFLDRVRHAA
jgi:hypothetical protein